MPESFDALACDLARFQRARIAGFDRLCKGIRDFERASDIPCVPTDVFKLTRVATFPEGEETAIFRTSGTTIGERGMHAMRTTDTYDAGALAFGRWALASDLGDRAPLVVSFTVKDADSSLGHMVELFRMQIGGGDGGNVLEGDVFDLVRLDEMVARAAFEERPVLLCATSFALAMFLEALDGEPFPLPPKSRVMQTGGFKGKVKEVEPRELRLATAKALRVDERNVVCEYGMTELSSQFYEATIQTKAPHSVYFEPPWARVVPVDPETLAPVPNGAEGIARIEDLLNVDSAFAVLARDRVMRVGEGFVLLGRASGAPPRGCSIAIEEMMG